MPHKFDPPFHAVFFFAPPVLYDATVPGRWPTLLDAPPVNNEQPEQWVERMRQAATFWADQDARNPERTAAADRAAKRKPARAASDTPPAPPGRPRVYATIEGESEDARRRRMLRERQDAWKERHGHKLPAGSVVMSRAELLALLAWFLAQSDGTGPTDAELTAGLAAAGVPPAHVA